MRSSLAVVFSVVLAGGACGGSVEPRAYTCDCSFDAGAPAPPPSFGRDPGPPDAAVPEPAPTGPAVLLFAGDGPRFLDDTWTWDGAAWTERTGEGAPPSRMRHAMASRAGAVVLFGGAHLGSTPLGDTWEWKDGRWTSAAVTGPSPRFDHAMATLGDAVVLYGGSGDGSDPTSGSETWIWDGASWKQGPAPSADGPGSRFGHAMATLGDKVVLYGGVGARGDTWEFDGRAWTKKTIPGPGERAFFAMATLGEKIVLFGGEADANHFLDDTWEYDGTSWTKRDAAGPSARFHHGMATLAGRVVLFGGESAAGVSPPWPADTWSWDGATWTKAEGGGPGGRDVYALAASR